MTILRGRTRGRGDTGSGRLHSGWSRVEVRIFFGANLFRLPTWTGGLMDDTYLGQGTEIRDTQYKHGGNKAATSRKLH